MFLRLVVAAGVAAIFVSLGAAFALAPSRAVNGPGIVVNRSIAGVAPGMTPAQVLARLGQPRVLGCNADEFGPEAVLWAWGGRLEYAPFRVVFNARKCTTVAGRHPPAVVVGYRGVNDVFTVLRAYRTSNGLGVGSTVAQLRAGLPANADCRGAFCFVRPGSNGIQTRFLLQHGRVVSVEIQRPRGAVPAPPPKAPAVRIKSPGCPPTVSLAAGGVVECDAVIVEPRADGIDAGIEAPTKWDFGDGTVLRLPAEETIARHTYTATGKYTISLTATYQGQTATATAVVTVTL